MVNMVIMCGKQIKNIRRKKEREFLDIKRKNIENTFRSIFYILPFYIQKFSFFFP
ncbi:MAG: hypothetical protein UW07_C0019G0001, partial [Candidatus Nomurabacteria bacterium GW2011_GWF2_43_8]